jgi:hypothetical protein
VGVGAWAHSPGVGVRACNVGVRAHGGCALRETDVGLWGYGKKRQKIQGEQLFFDPHPLKNICFSISMRP